MITIGDFFSILLLLIVAAILARWVLKERIKAKGTKQTLLDKKSAFVVTMLKFALAEFRSEHWAVKLNAVIFFAIMIISFLLAFSGIPRVLFQNKWDLLVWAATGFMITLIVFHYCWVNCISLVKRYLKQN